MHSTPATRRTRNTRAFLCLFHLSALVVLALGCASTTTDPDPEATEPTTTASGSSGATSEFAEPKSLMELEAIYFDTDDAHLRVDARSVLAEHAKVIARNPQWGVITIEGHCDERGSDAYNHALGTRRAESVQRFLLAQGVPESRIEIRTMGKNQPAVPGHGEQAWKQNRRSEFRGESLASNRS